MKHISRFTSTVGQAARAGFTLMELMVVIGIAALLLTISATAFFGASREENLTRSRDQLRDILLSARQRACIEGVPYVVICYNTTSEIEVGSSTEKIDQGRFAMFRSVGRVWPIGDKLAAPFGFQRDQLGTLAKKERLINLDDPEKKASGGSSQFMRVKNIAKDPNRLSNDSDSDNSGNAISTLDYEFKPMGNSGSTETLQLRAPVTGTNYGFYVAELESSSGENDPFPLGVRETETFSLPSGYKFNNDRIAIVFLPDGRAEKTVTVSASTSMGGNTETPTFSISVSTEGEVDIN